MKKGKFIVIDGTDGTGKGTQTTKLVERLKNQGHDVELMDFPQYGNPSAWFVEEYLNGNFGTINEVTPKQASYFYALDRYVASFKLREYLDQGKIVISNRYVTASMGHQGTKFDNVENRKEFFSWLYNLEYNDLQIPKPDLTLIMHMPADIAQKLVDEKGHRDYVGGEKRDIHEADLGHLEKAEKVYLEMADLFEDFELIECYEGNRLLSIDEVHEKVWKIIKNEID